MEGTEFHCPWTERLLKSGNYAVDHIIPITVLPINELWNLVPSDPYFNSHFKKHRLPSSDRLANAQPFLVETYIAYQSAVPLQKSIREEVNARFSEVPTSPVEFAVFVAKSIAQFVEHVASSRNLSRF